MVRQARFRCERRRTNQAGGIPKPKWPCSDPSFSWQCAFCNCSNLLHIIRQYIMTRWQWATSQFHLMELGWQTGRECGESRWQLKTFAVVLALVWAEGFGILRLHFIKYKQPTQPRPQVGSALFRGLQLRVVGRQGLWALPRVSCNPRAFFGQGL